MSRLDDIRSELREHADSERARHMQRYFKTGPGEYGEGDRFLGLRMGTLRRLASAYRDVPLSDVTTLLRSPIHEERMLALLLMVQAYQRGDEPLRQELYRVYLDHTPYVNNWDLVDASAPHLVGAHLMHRDRALLYELAQSDLVWDRRIAVISTFYFIKRGDFDDTLCLAELLIEDPHELVQKAVGWMLREVGNRDRSIAEHFLRRHYPSMPRTMLRYAIERFPEPLRQQYLKGML